MLSDLTAQTIGLVVLGGFLGGIASGAAGFAYGVVATSIWLHAISPLHAALLVVTGGTGAISLPILVSEITPPQSLGF